MKIYICMLISMISIGCSSPDDASVASDASAPDTAQRTPPPYPEMSDLPDPEGPGLCQKFDTFTIDAGDGYFVFHIPLPCDPLWKLKDRGDPPFKANQR